MLVSEERTKENPLSGTDEFIDRLDLAERSKEQPEKKSWESREFAENLIESMKDAISILDGDGRYIHVNSAFSRMTGFTKDDLAGKEPPFPYWPEEECGNIMRSFEEVLGGNFEEIEAIFKRKNGERFPVLISPSCLKDQNGNVVSFFSTMKDLTERKKVEVELHKAQKLESIGILAGGIAHDFNNILTAIFNDIALAKDSDSKEYREKWLTKAEAAAMRARDLSYKLLTFSKGGSPVKNLIDPGAFLKESVSLSLAGTNLKPVFLIQPSLPPIEADENQLNQVIHNIILNSAQAMPSGGTLNVSAGIEKNVRKNIPGLPGGDYILFTIEDLGAGMDEYLVPKAFDPFFTTKEKASGLGLSTAYSIIKSHGGHISMRSRAGEGTTVYIYLPMIKKKISAEKSDGSEVKLTGKVLVMDDEELIRETAGEVLSRMGFTVEYSVDGTEAIDLYRQAFVAGEPYRAVIMDLTIPGGMGGKEAVGLLKEIDPGVKAIVSSGYSNDPVMAEYEKYGFSGIIIKPYKASDLVGAVKRIMAS